jgi:hypothetical protein
MSDNIVKFPLRRSDRLYSLDNLLLDLPPRDNGRPIASNPDTAILVGIILRLVQRGVIYDRLPTIVRRALDDFCADGDATSKLVRSWLLERPFDSDDDLGPCDIDRLIGSRFDQDRIFRHGRFWRPDSPYLHRADAKRRAALAQMLVELEGHE